MTVIDIIRKIEQDKRSRNKEPSYALYYEVLKEASGIYHTFTKQVVNAELEELVKANIITIGDTINDNYIKLL